VLIVISIIKDSQLESTSPVASKKIEIKRSSIVGYSHGKLSWQMQADYVWAGRSRYLFQADRIKNGKLYDSKGVLVVDNIRAERVRVNTKSKTLSAFDNIHAVFIQRGNGQKKASITSGELRYFSSIKRTYLYKDVQIIRDDTVIYPNKGVESDHDKNAVYINDGFTMQSDDFVVSANKMTIYIDENYSEMSGNIIFKRIAEAVTTDDDLDSREKILRQKGVVLTCDYMTYINQDNNDEIKVNGNIKMVQSGKVITGDRGYYNKDDDYYELNGGVVIKADSLKWLLNKEPSLFKNEGMKDSLEMPVEIATNQLRFNATEKVLELIGDVIVTLKDKVITCEKLMFDDTSDWVTLIGNVTMIKDNNDKIMGSRLKLNINDETVVVSEGVVTEFRVK
jgi:lipopolysaccharide export system protein LptA